MRLRFSRGKVRTLRQGAEAVFTYAEAETVLAQVYEADATVQRAAFRGRLKHLKRLGVPLAMAPGKGAKIAYEYEHLYQWCLCLELEEFGVDPTLIVAILREYWNGGDAPLVGWFMGAAR